MWNYIYGRLFTEMRNCIRKSTKDILIVVYVAHETELFYIGNIISNNYCYGHIVRFSLIPLETRTRCRERFVQSSLFGDCMVIGRL